MHLADLNYFTYLCIMKKFITIVIFSLSIIGNIQGQEKRQGVASYYHDSLHGNLTANGEIYNKNKISAAHKTLPFGTILLITNKNNGKSIIVRINDRGPFIKGRDIDLSKKAAEELSMIWDGVINIEWIIIDDLYNFLWDNNKVFKMQIM